MFLLGCMGTRSLLAYAAKRVTLAHLRYLVYLALPIGLGFVYIYLFGSAAADKQLEWAGEKTIWWNDLRIVHGVNYLVFALLAMKKQPYAWIIIAIDTAIGLISWLVHHEIVKFS